MIKLKHRKVLFWMLLALLAGGSMALYAESDANALLKTIAVVLFQQTATILIYLSCFGWDLLRSR